MSIPILHSCQCILVAEVWHPKSGGELPVFNLHPLFEGLFAFAGGPTLAALGLELFDLFGVTIDVPSIVRGVFSRADASVHTWRQTRSFVR